MVSDNETEFSLRHGLPPPRVEDYKTLLVVHIKGPEQDRWQHSVFDFFPLGRLVGKQDLDILKLL